MIRACVCLALLAMSSTPVFATQSCDTKLYPLSAPTSRFIDNHDGTVTDTSTRMMWMRCSIGQNWNGSACDKAPASLSWQAALDAAATVNKQGGYASHDDWRMPHIPELANIVERQCADPRINVAVFPDTPAAFYWTASNRPGKGNEDQAFILSFGPEGTGGDVKNASHFVRLVRGIPK
jgi:hypothetical protein